jgi:hypothetical protein
MRGITVIKFVLGVVLGTLLADSIKKLAVAGYNFILKKFEKDQY